jgi:hypothetical protein
MAFCGAVLKSTKLMSLITDPQKTVFVQMTIVLLQKILASSAMMLGLRIALSFAGYEPGCSLDAKHLRNSKHTATISQSGAFCV